MSTVASPLKRAAIWPLGLLIALQLGCTVVFLGDVITDLAPYSAAAWSNPSNMSEVAATVGLLLGLVFETYVMWRMIARQSRMEHSLNVASGALSDIMQSYFESWGLTPTEQDVAAFTIKGCSIAEIAELRGSAEGTIKTHLNAIYRKSGVSGRAQLVSVLVEDLLQGPLVAPATDQTQPRRTATG
jgi:DNA-binding CsgD family transcriptional regulator